MLLRIQMITIILAMCYSSMQAQWQFEGSPESGYVTNYSTDGTRTYLLAVAGLFVSQDDGNTWSNIPLPDSIFLMNEVHAEGGSIYLYTRWDWLQFFPMAFYRSDDMGQTWMNILPDYDFPFGFSRPLIKGDTVMVAGDVHHFTSFNKGNTYTDITDDINNDKLFYHQNELYTLDGEKLYTSSDMGNNWELIYTSPDTFSALEVYATGNVLYRIETDENIASPTVYIHSSSDSGVTWTLKSILHSIEFWQPVMIGEGGQLFLYTTEGVLDLYHSADGGTTWQEISDAPSSSQYSFSDGVLYVEDIEQLIFSKDLGETFESHQSGFTAADITKICPGHSGLFAVANEAVFQKDESNAWTSLPTFEDIFSTEDGHLIAEVDFDFVRSSDGGISWDTIQPADFGQSQIPPFSGFSTANNVFFLDAYPLDWISTDYGATWQQFEVNNSEDSGLYLVAYDETGYVFVDDFLGIYKTVDLVNWVDITYDLFDPFLNDFEYVFCHNGYVYIKTTISLYRLAPGETEWLVLSPDFSGHPPASQLPYFSCLASSGDILFAGLYGWGVYASLDNGNSWTAFNLGLSDYQVRTLKVLNDTLYAGVDGGLWARPVSEFVVYAYSGIVYNDKNANGIQEQGEDGLVNIFVEKKNENKIFTSDSDGHFQVYGESISTDTIQAVAPLYGSISTAPHVVSDPVDSLKIGVHFIPGIYDASVVITNSVLFRPGFESSIVITYKNKGTETTDLDVQFILPDQLEYISASLDPTIFSDTLSWHIQGVAPGASGNIYIDIKTKASVPIGSLVYLDAFIEIQENSDADPLDNEDHVAVAVVGSIDPNDKTVSPSGYITPMMIADTQRLEYTIRFQNTGNFPASFVRIQDTLSSHLDLSSLEILSASHSYTWQLLPQNVLDVYFENINLPDSTADERSSHGFVKFAINAKTNLQLADHIDNTAYIYFDFNQPVVTNTVRNNVGFGTGTKDPSKRLSLSASPVPTKDFVTISIDNADVSGDVKLSLYDSKGVSIKSQTAFDTANIRIDMRELPSGIYLLQTKIGDKRGTISIVKN
ncbi:MAG: T9SS type A sorting domain-containing protein [Saprospiraceae bacterium]|nr:T9SS type A sorting domain-containing protein [Saprospiraceae bacterium]